MLELRRDTPNWFGALSVALTRPHGVPERRAGEDPWHTDAKQRPRRVTDDLAWLRQAFEEPELHGLRPVAIDGWEPDAAGRERLARLRDRHVLAAAGFELTEAAGRPRTAGARFERQPASGAAHTSS
jgi:hypothetical protein